MTHASTADLHNDMAMRLAPYGVAGIWCYNHSSGRLRLWGHLNQHLARSPEEAETGLPLAVFLARIHPTDRMRLENTLYEASGQIEMQFRAIGPNSTTRRLMICGQTERDDAGNIAVGQGILLDMTEIRAEDIKSPQRIVNRMAEHVIALRELADILQKPFITAIIEALMREIGSELAIYLPPPRAQSGH